MVLKNHMLILFVMVLIFLSACTSPGNEQTIGATEIAKIEPILEATEIAEAEPVLEATSKASESPEIQTSHPAEEDMSRPEWLVHPLTEVTTGDEFTINSFAGKVVLVETMAIWCSSCKRQQQELIKLHELLGERDDFVSIGLAIDTNEVASDLQKYVADNHFDWLYAISPVPVSREIGNLYGNQFLNPPSTPMLLIDKHGEVHPLRFGIKLAAELQELLEPFLKDGL
jgi:thiol-disulfide isomerase/thioredoxin